MAAQGRKDEEARVRGREGLKRGGQRETGRGLHLLSSMASERERGGVLHVRGKEGVRVGLEWSGIGLGERERGFGLGRNLGPRH